MIVLYKVDAQARRFLKGILIETLEEEAACVTKDLGLNDENVGNFRRDNLHGCFGNQGSWRWRSLSNRNRY